jgi:hypothetical protein
MPLFQSEIEKGNAKIPFAVLKWRKKGNLYEKRVIGRA